MSPLFELERFDAPDTSPTEASEMADRERIPSVKRIRDRPPQRIAVFCPNLIGDTVMATPALRALRLGYPPRPHHRRDQAARGTYSGRGCPGSTR